MSSSYCFPLKKSPFFKTFLLCTFTMLVALTVAYLKEVCVKCKFQERCFTVKNKFTKKGFRCEIEMVCHEKKCNALMFAVTPVGHRSFAFTCMHSPYCFFTCSDQKTTHTPTCIQIRFPLKCRSSPFSPQSLIQ